jgi:hypothetical protein
MSTIETLKPGIASCDGEDIEQMSRERDTQKPGIAVYDGKDILGDNILMLLFVIVVQSNKFHVGLLANDTNHLHNTIIARMVFVHALIRDYSTKRCKTTIINIWHFVEG